MDSERETLAAEWSGANRPLKQEGGSNFAQDFEQRRMSGICRDSVFGWRFGWQGNEYSLSSGDTGNVHRVAR